MTVSEMMQTMSGGAQLNSTHSLPSVMFGAGTTHLMNPLKVFLLPLHYCGLGAGFTRFWAIVNKKQCETRRLLMSLVT